jgi:hypothetical protein
MAARPFGPGERLTYEIRFGALRLGRGEMEVQELAIVRGQPAYHTVFRVQGGTPFFRVDDLFESWFATSDLSSLRFHQDQDEGPKQRRRRYEIYPDRQRFEERTAKPGKQGERPSVANPLDDGSFLYFLRTVPLEVGRTSHFHQYFKPERNPVTIKVLRRERIKVPAGTFDAIVVQPVISTTGIFAEGGRAEVWLSDDSRRMMLQLKSKVSFGSLNLYLTTHRPPTAAATPLAAR